MQFAIPSSLAMAAVFPSSPVEFIVNRFQPQEASTHRDVTTMTPETRNTLKFALDCARQRNVEKEKIKELFE